MKITCGACQKQFGLNLDGVHHQKFQFKCPGCGGLVMVDRSAAPSNIKVAKNDSEPASKAEGGVAAEGTGGESAGSSAPAAAAQAVAPELDAAARFRREIRERYPELMKQNYFELLGVAKDVPLDPLKSAYFKLAKHFHPDRFVASLAEADLAKVREISSRINQAFQELRVPATREEYIKKLADPDREKKKLECNAIIEAMIDHEKGRMAMKQSNFEVALQHFQRAIALHPGEAEYHFLMGQALQRARGVDKADVRRTIEEAFRKAVEIAPQSAAYQMGIGQYWRARGDNDKAMNCFRAALKLDPNLHEARREVRLHQARKERDKEDRKEPGRGARAGSGWADKLGFGAR